MITLLSPNPQLALRQVEEEVRKVLAALPAGSTITTGYLVELIADPSFHTQLFKMVGRLPSTLYSTHIGEGKGWSKGKEVKRKLWHALLTAAMPERPATPSQGAASNGYSMVAHLAELDKRLAAVESALLLTKGTEA